MDGDGAVVHKSPYAAGAAALTGRMLGAVFARLARVFLVAFGVAVPMAVACVLAPASAEAADGASGGSGGNAAWVWPIAGHPSVVHGFDPPAQRWLPGHRGVDLAAAPGTPVRAAGAGTVGYAGVLAGRGVVTVVHGSLRTTYEPVEASVRRGEQVSAGQVIGRVQDVPGHCRPRSCLHWGLLRGDDYLNPLSLVREPIRLLPVWGVPRPDGERARQPAASPSRQPTAPKAGVPPTARADTVPRAGTSLTAPTQRGAATSSSDTDRGVATAAAAGAGLGLAGAGLAITRRRRIRSTSRAGPP